MNTTQTNRQAKICALMLHTFVGSTFLTMLCFQCSKSLQYVRWFKIALPAVSRHSAGPARSLPTLFTYEPLLVFLHVLTYLPQLEERLVTNRARVETTCHGWANHKAVLLLGLTSQHGNRSKLYPTMAAVLCWIASSAITCKPRCSVLFTGRRVCVVAVVVAAFAPTQITSCFQVRIRQNMFSLQHQPETSPIAHLADNLQLTQCT